MHRHIGEKWQSEVKAALGGKTEELERLAIEMYARGLSMRDIEAAFTDNNGRCVLSRSAASGVAEQLWVDYQAFATRSLAEIPMVYLFVDGVAERLHLGQPREAILAAWGIAEDGTEHLLGLLPGTKEDTASAREFLRDLKARGLRDRGGYHRRGAGTYPSRGRSLPQEFASAVPGPRAAKFAIEGARGALAGSDPRGPCHLPSSESRIGAHRPRGVRQKLEQRVAFGRGLF